ncbi:hypothetical protein [Mesorhizobium sp. B2-3-12]|uniref:hypothetical protein n=1 Tax=Mesorhizobium sp. B2-3-12 TaxID=2589952 RepID=UPI001128C052|nr:hypothetical protein [Mesorhizobium sp. B2-3-12]
MTEASKTEASAIGTGDNRPLFGRAVITEQAAPSSHVREHGARRAHRLGTTGGERRAGHPSICSNLVALPIPVRLCDGRFPAVEGGLCHPIFSAVFPNC